MPELRKKPVVVIIRDGWGENPDPKWNHANAIHLAKTPVADQLMANYPNVLIHTSGEDVGLPTGVMGNSEVGHQNIGAGRIVDQEVMRITRSIREGEFFENPVLNGAIEHVRSTGGRLHLLGLMSDGRVHSDIEHAYAIMTLVKNSGLRSDQFAIHAITDGRDTSPNGGRQYIAQLEDRLKTAGVGKIASVVGRFYAMDRDLRWERVAAAYQMLTRGSQNRAVSAASAIEDYYANPTEPNRSGDEFIEATSIQDSDGNLQLVSDGDAVVFLNYRGDRTREITKAFVYTDENWANIEGGGFDRGPRIDNLYFATMTGYESGLPVKVIFEKRERMTDLLGEYISKLGLSQLRCAETEKYPHVTFFFNDYFDDPFSRESRSMIPSARDVSTYDQKPEMSAIEIADAVIDEIQQNHPDLVIVNFANGDMVGHTGNLPAAIAAVETVDQCVGRVVETTLAAGGSLIVTADHGNCEQMIDPTSGGPHTAHTTFDVPLIIVDSQWQEVTLREGGRLADIAPTALALLGLDIPSEMTGQSLTQAMTNESTP